MNINWYEYIRQGPMLEFKNKKDESLYNWLNELSQKLWSFYHGDLRYKNCAKMIIVEKTNAFAVAKGCKNYCFRFQCLLTGRQSKYIKEDELIDFGISPIDAKCGGDFLERQKFDDKILPKLEKINKAKHELFKTAKVCDGKSWHERYSEYLNSAEWYEKRVEVLQRDNNKCVISGRTYNLQVHHLTYARVGNELLSDLVTLNREIHKLIHAGDEYYTRKLKEVVQ